MLELIIHIASVILPATVVYVTYKQNQLNSSYLYADANTVQFSKYYYLILFISTLYFSEYFIHLVVPNVGSLNEYLSFGTHYVISPNNYFAYNRILYSTIKNCIYSIPLTIFLYLSVSSLTKIKSFQITLAFLFLIEPLQYVVNTITLSNYHYISFFDILFYSLGASLGMAIIVLVPQITNLKNSICESTIM